MEFEQVTQVWAYHDQPVSGVANYNGRPHKYERQFDDGLDDYTDMFRLTPLDQGLMDLIDQNWETWLKWRAAFDRGECELNSHPQFGQNTAEREASKVAIDERIEALAASSFLVAGLFRYADPSGINQGSQAEWAVAWEMP